MLNLCQVCSKEPSKYKCPKCALMSCSLGCTQSHKIYCAPKPTETVPKDTKDLSNGAAADPLKDIHEGEPLKLEDLGSSIQLQKLFEQYPGLRRRLQEIYKITLEEEWDQEQNQVSMGNHHRRHRGGHKRGVWTAEKGFNRGLGKVRKWRESCEDGESVGSDAEGFMKFMALVAGTHENPT
ncbi:hypothetical protein BGW36DRAFT_130523 [Talaromyces proteolyticus]|uniref:HIT-type domain-containing protein n=1 Tax=Talaromyces proteolyticus TaxID=1131652 RepID=A0AAD4KZ73_9EURO|nr:uncharacterized protein BGW36DRAFT_130523 [Talaromyces proteolyticus]KAH8700530.1 hypothetical protein BGW36DRAFT_130523 [Talaromyces proteolyticus]